MSGRWTRFYDPKKEQWFDIYVELPRSFTKGVGWVATNGGPVELLGPDGKPLTGRPAKAAIGFRQR